MVIQSTIGVEADVTSAVPSSTLSSMGLCAVNVGNFLLEAKDPSRVALQFLDGPCTYGELDSASRKMASFLVASGARKGDRAVLVAENSPFWVASYLGILRAGLVCVPLPIGTTTEDFAFIVRSVGPRFAFLESRFQQKNQAALAGATVVPFTQSVPRVTPGDYLRNIESIFPHDTATNVLGPEVGSRDLAAIMYTSGSTAKPRGVMVTHGNIVANTNSIVEYLRLTDQ